MDLLRQNHLRTAITQIARKLGGRCADSELAKRLECAASRRYSFACCRDIADGRTQSAGIRRTPNASRDSVATLRRYIFHVSVCLALLLAGFVREAPNLQAESNT